MNINDEYKKVMPELIHNAIKAYFEAETLTEHQLKNMIESLDKSYAIFDHVFGELFESKASNNLVQSVQLTRQLIDYASRYTDQVDLIGYEINTVEKDLK